MIAINPSPIEQVTFRGRSYFIKRDDLLHPILSGNKYRKFYSLLQQDFSAYTTIVSHGSSQSNAMYALSFLAREKQVDFQYYVHHISDFLKENPHGNYHYALQNGMQILESSIPTSFDTKTCFIPEGGHSKSSEEGIKILADELKTIDADIFLPSGTGTTALYLQKHTLQRVYTCACVGDSTYLERQMRTLEPNLKHYPTILQPPKKYHFGKLYREFLDIWIELREDTNIEFDLLYDPLGWLCVTTHLQHHPKPILYIHQGGLVGNESMRLRYMRRYSDGNQYQ